MSFGFSVGDFIAVGKLIGDITSSLQSVGGAKSEYQELIREFQFLDAALRHLDRLESNAANANTLVSIKYAALSCRHPLEEFLKKIRKYEKSLGPWSHSSTIKTATSQLRWTFGHNDDVKRLQTYLSVHMGTINILLAEYGLERMQVYDEKAESTAQQVRIQANNAHALLENLRRDLPGQELLLRRVHSMLDDLYHLVCGEMRTSLQHFAQSVKKVCVSTQQIYTVVLEIRNSLTVVDTRWTHFQAPFTVEDALGFKFPVPSEYDFALLDSIIQIRFKRGAGSKEVKSGKYELCKSKKRSETVTATSRLVPGTAITMAIIVDTAMVNESTCPMPHCRSRQASACPGGGFIWYVSTWSR
ncbi:uncharacterized protein EKO05_0004418 [Ascochyta rabiei]|uniref:uncharacterized protein n=1 Tax=Didymella rabiei TaxID=5454 RepID=UPI002203F1B3|nr:uncharacterized protein EKO05_0004418 [Ascochyta rabiei]UPX13923.1 hypothetical protein EKO05_0004418 [Ascochyta rabiei]